MTIDPSAIQLEALVVGLLAAAIGFIGARGPLRSLDVAAVAATAYLAWNNQVPEQLVILIAVAAVLPRPGPQVAKVLVAVALAVAMATVADDPTAGAVVLLVGGTLAAAPAAWSERATDAVPAALGIAGALVATIFGGPDTEAAFAAVAALGPLALLDRRLSAPGGIGLAAPLLTTFVAVDAYRGRPGGLPAAAVALVALGLCLALAQAGTARSSRAVLAMASVAAIAGPVAARTIGLDGVASTTDLAWVVMAAVVALVGGAWALSAPAAARTPPT